MMGFMTVYLQNKKARFDFTPLETLEAGIELFGFEVKSVRGKKGKLEGSHVTVRGGEALLLGANIPAFQPKNAPESYAKDRHRRLLLSAKQIDRLAGLESQKGLTIIPISMYNSGRKIKLEIAVVRGQKKHDKRETLKRRDMQREAERAMKQRR